MLTSTPPPRNCVFGPITVAYGARVLVPRPWTLAQSEWAAELARHGDAGEPLLELCAGAGHTGLAAAVLADRDLVQVELDPVAAGYAAANARHAGRHDRVEIRNQPLQTAVHPDETFHLMIADPPTSRTTPPRAGQRTRCWRSTAAPMAWT
jgi:methylase of polypeptide subunit release factors